MWPHAAHGLPSLSLRVAAVWQRLTALAHVVACVFVGELHTHSPFIRLQSPPTAWSGAAHAAEGAGGDWQAWRAEGGQHACGRTQATSGKLRQAAMLAAG